MAPPVHFDGLRDFVINRKKVGEPNRIFEGWYFFGADNDWHILPRYGRPNGFCIQRYRTYDHGSILSSVQLVPSPSLSWAESYTLITSGILADRMLYKRNCSVAGDFISPYTTLQYEEDYICAYGAVLKCPIYLGRDSGTPVEPFWKFLAPDFGGTGSYYSTSSVTIKRGCTRDNSTLNYSTQYTPVDAAAWDYAIDTSLPTTTDTVSNGSWATNTASTFTERRMFFITDSSFLTPSSNDERLWYFVLSRNDYRTGYYLFPSGSKTWAVGDCIVYSNAFYQCNTSHTASSWVAANWTNKTGDVFNSIVNRDSIPWDTLESDTIENEAIYGIYCISGFGNLDDGDYTFTPATVPFQISTAEIQYSLIRANPLRVLYMNKAQKTKIYGNGWP